MASGDAAPIAAKDAAGKLAREAQLDCSGGIVAESGKMSADLVRVKTPKPATPDAVVAALIGLSRRLGRFDRVSIGFPGVVRAEFVLTAPNLGTKEWHGFRLGAIMAKDLGKPPLTR